MHHLKYVIFDIFKLSRVDLHHLHILKLSFVYSSILSSGRQLQKYLDVKDPLLFVKQPSADCASGNRLDDLEDLADLSELKYNKSLPIKVK